MLNRIVQIETGIGNIDSIEKKNYVKRDYRSNDHAWVPKMRCYRLTVFRRRENLADY